MLASDHPRVPTACLAVGGRSTTWVLQNSVAANCESDVATIVLEENQLPTKQNQ